MTRHSPLAAIASSGLTAEPNGITPAPLPLEIARRVTAAQNRGEIRILEVAGDGLFLQYGPFDVIASIGRHEATGRLWAHLSTRRRRSPDGNGRRPRLPTWEELVQVRDVVLGDDVEAYQIAPPVDRYVNRHPGVLHLWAPLDGPVLPAFETMASDGKLTV